MTAPPPEPPLPHGWEKMTDRPTVYYKNSFLQVEQADRPGLPENPAVGAILCGASLPLDPVAAECSANAPPPPLKAYLLSILTPILSDAVMSQALTPEVLARMKALNDPQVQQVLANFKANVQTAVQASADILNKGVGDNIGELLGSIVNKLSSAIQLLIADLPGWGVVMSGAELADTALSAVKQGKVIANEVQHAFDPLNAIGEQVAQVTSAVDAATASVNDAASAATTNAVSVATPSVATPSATTPSVATPSATTPSAKTTSVVSEAPENADKSGNVVPENAVPENAVPENAVPENAVPVTPSGATASGATASEATASGATASEATASEDKSSNAVTENAVPVTPKKGGSRKRRRIHKVSRRIERTLRRVQKKYGLRDKNDFLRRTLRVRKK